MLENGRVIAEGTSDELKAQVGGDRLEIQLDDPAESAAALTALAAIADGEPSVEGSTVRVPLRRRRGAIADAVRSLDEAGVGIVGRRTLDDVFLTLTGHKAETDEADSGGDAR